MTAKPFIEDLSKEFIQETLDEARLPVEIAVFGLDNGYNVGGIIRTAHSFLVSKIHFIKVDWFYEKAALSTLRWEKKNIVRWDTEEAFLDHVAASGRALVACEKRPNLTTEDIRTFTYPENSILLFGSEKYGVPDLLLDKSNHVISIPMLGLSNDFNVSVAFGMVIYDWYRKHTCKM
jgi:tRNA G18 (ribose-2'-O)-methylase SpoU